MPGHGVVRNLTAAYELIARAGLTHHRPPFGITHVTVGNREVEVREEAAHVTPFGTLLHFKKDIDTEQPRVLLVAPLSGHFATLLRGTVRTMLPEHDVYITDWHNMRDVAALDGRFGFDEYVEHLIKFIEVIGEGAHVLAVCQPCVAVLEAVAVMAQSQKSGAAAQHDPDGGADRHAGQSDQGERACQFQIDRLVREEPDRAGAVSLSRRVSSGLSGLRAACGLHEHEHRAPHQGAQGALREHPAGRAWRRPRSPRISTTNISRCSISARSSIWRPCSGCSRSTGCRKGTLEWQGEKVEPRAIRRTALLTVEGERDDICAVGQTLAAHDLCSSLRPYRKRHHMQAGVGHYGVFSGKRWEHQIYPLVKNVILSSE